MFEGVYGCFMTCKEFLAGNSEVSLELQCLTAELITYIVCESDAPECLWKQNQMIISKKYAPLGAMAFILVERN